MKKDVSSLNDGKREYHQISDLISDELKALFCEEHNYEDIDLYDGHIVVLEYQTIEEYYGHRLIEPVIVYGFPISVIEEWVANKLKSSK